MTKGLKKSLVVVLGLTMAVSSLSACGKKTDAPAASSVASVEESTASVEESSVEVVDELEAEILDEFDVLALNSKEYGVDYTSLYDAVGKTITIADVEEDPETGFGYITVDGKKQQLGLDFLSMAMVYNNTPSGDYATEDDVYAAWWRLYITRWNYLLPEVPLYSNEYYDLYNAQIVGTSENPTNPFWSPTDALIDWSSTKADNDIIVGNSTELSGQFRDSVFGKTSPGASDQDIDTLVNGLDTVARTKEGGYTWNDTVVASHDAVVNDDGSKTFTIKIKEGLKLSDGSEVTAKNYLAKTLAKVSAVGTEAAGRASNAESVVGFEAYQAYDGTEGTKEFAGLRLLDDYTFAVTIEPKYIPYFYDITYAGFTAYSTEFWLGENDILDDGNGCYLSDSFYEKNADGNYVMAKFINENCTSTTDEAYAKYPYSGPYKVVSFDSTDSSAILEKNEFFAGNYEGTVPSIEKISYKKTVDATQLEDFKAGGLDVIAGITGGAATDEALKLADESDGKYTYSHYSRAGYGKLGFRADFGPAQFKEVRQAIAYCMNRGQFAKDFTGGYGGVVDGPYYTGSWMYKEAVNQGMLLDSYATSADSAIAILEEGGWVYDKDGNDYVEGVRYKKIPGDLIAEKDKTFQSVDGAYTVTEVNGDYYMPLVINWYGTADNEFTDLLQTGFKENANIAAAGMVVYNTIGDFAPMLDELYEQAVYGYYSGTPMYCAFNFATGFNSAVYDYATYITIDPSKYDDYSNWYIKDPADIFYLK